MKIFLAGVMQGNKKVYGIRSQDYRKKITGIIKAVLPNATVIDPDITDPNRLSYTKEQSSDMFFRYCKMASEVDLVVSFIPEASMGSAIEMWIAYNAKIPILTISPMDYNWVVKLLSRKIYLSIEEFENNFTSTLLKELNFT